MAHRTDPEILELERSFRARGWSSVRDNWSHVHTRRLPQEAQDRMAIATRRRGLAFLAVLFLIGLVASSQTESK